MGFLDETGEIFAIQREALQSEDIMLYLSTIDQRRNYDLYVELLHELQQLFNTVREISQDVKIKNYRSDGEIVQIIARHSLSFVLAEQSVSQVQNLLIEMARSDRGWKITRQTAIRTSYPGWQSTQSTHFVFHYPSDSPVVDSLNEISGIHETSYQQVSSFLEVNEPLRIHVFFYNSQDHGQKLLGRPVGFANAKLKEIHVLHSAAKHPKHELTHIVAAKLGRVYSPLLGEGLAVYMASMEDELHDGAARLLVRGQLLPLAGLSESFRHYPEEYVYPQSGSFVKFLIEKYGLNSFKQLLVSEDMCTSLQEIYEVPLTQLEEHWRSVLRVTHMGRSDQQPISGGELAGDVSSQNVGASPCGRPAGQAQRPAPTPSY